MKNKFAKISLFAAGLLAITGCSNNNGNYDDTGDDINDQPSGEVDNSYENPLSSSDIADPTAVRVGNSVYIFCTGGNVYKIDEFSKRPKELTKVVRTEAWGPSQSAIWAPDVVKVKDTWIYYYSNSQWGATSDTGIGFMTASSVEGPWTDHGKLFDSEEIGVENSIDPCVVADEDGQLWMSWGSFQGLFITPLSDDGQSLKYPIVEGQEYDHKTLIGGIVGPWNGETYEGSYIKYKDAYYYLFASQGTCCDGADSTYHVKVARSRSITGPYVDSKGVDFLGEDRGELVVKGNKYVAGPGHNSIIVDDNDDWRIVYHGYDAMYPLGRNSCVAKLEWDDNGFPYVENYEPSFEEEMDGPVFK